MNMLPRLASLVGVSLVAVSGFCLAAGDAELPAGTNALERMHIKNAKCSWTREIGDYIYQCLKDNFGMNAHWCHNEAMELLCPKQLGAAGSEAPVPAK